MIADENPSALEQSILLHLLSYRGAQVRFEADQRTTEFGILRSFESEDATRLRASLHQLEIRRFVYRRMQYVIGYSEPKLVYSLTASGHRVALSLSKSQAFSSDPSGGETGTGPSRRSPGWRPGEQNGIGSS